MTTPTLPDLEITQSDRDESARLAAAMRFVATEQGLPFTIEDNFAGSYFARHRVESLRTQSAALAQERAKVEWQPIETAPKDGTLIDIWRGGEFPGRTNDVSWREPSDSEWWVHGGDTIETPDATWHDGFGPLGKDGKPTHWMPVPSPPELLQGTPK